MTQPITTRLHDSRSAQAFADDVQYYLSLQPRQLPSRYLYDALGSALFEAICRLPWYRITRAETRLLDTHGRRIFRRLDPLSTLVELGPGSGEKLVTLIASGRSRPAPLEVHLVDVSAAALDSSSRLLGRWMRSPLSRTRRRMRPDWPRSRHARARAAGCWSCFSDRTSATSIRPARTPSCAAFDRRSSRGRRS